ncbi:OmpA family protein [Nitrosococcus wardiae]|uniref:OmpA family protein n=1 Tax=Nitrosococcus wardiae TaxID=1814290 RepID=A0A4P7BYE9_9GAMM|nr:OmpA family protein [Nitrosococcus wardiae]QBQ54357.1 OmpA family protein [Nitrosococcus wardiae]
MPNKPILFVANIFLAILIGCASQQGVVGERNFDESPAEELLEEPVDAFEDEEEGVFEDEEGIFQEPDAYYEAPREELLEEQAEASEEMEESNRHLTRLERLRLQAAEEIEERDLDEPPAEEFLEEQVGVFEDEEERVFEDEEGIFPVFQESDAQAVETTVYTIYLDPLVAVACQVDKNKTFFEFDSAKLTPNAKQRLDQIAQCLESGALQDQRVALIGHADPRGPESYNDDLARQRAENVAQYLYRQGIPADRIDVVSLGEKFAEVNQQGYRFERRVSIVPGNPYGAFNAWDRNRDKRVTPEEFQQGMAQNGTFAPWDRNRDQQLTQDEFAHSLFTVWNIDRADGLTQEEFKAGADTWFGDDYADDFDTWDLNGDEFLEPQEFTTGFAELDVWNDWDADRSGWLTKREWNEGLFELWDENQDEILTEEEFYVIDYGSRD